MSSFTTSARASIPNRNSGIAMTIQASAAGSNPASGVIFVAINTSNDVAELRTLPEMVSSVAETTGCCSASESRRSLTLWKVRPRTCIACDGIADVGRLNGCLRGYKISAGWLFVTNATLKTFLGCST
jgi:hypothetical protein